MKTILFLIILFSLSSLRANPDAPFLQESATEELVIYNRILAKVNDKTISVVDVMKNMDMYLQKSYPHLANSKLAKYQFYSSQWRDFLTQMIDTELMLADAEKVELKVSESEVREQVLDRFGPNIMAVLDDLGLTYEEARKMIHDDMVVQRMTWLRVNSKALHSINSQDIKQAYLEFCEKNPEMKQWQYQVLSIRSPDKGASQSLAERAFELLSAKLDFETISHTLKTPDEMTTISISEEVQADEKSISSSHKQVLMTLSENSFSEPIAQVSRVDNSVVYRIFHLKKVTQTQIPLFEKMADQIKDQLLQTAANKQSSQYIVKLRERWGFDEKHMMETLPSDFQPFELVAK